MLSDKGCLEFARWVATTLALQLVNVNLHPPLHAKCIPIIDRNEIIEFLRYTEIFCQDLSEDVSRHFVFYSKLKGSIDSDPENTLNFCFELFPSPVIIEFDHKNM